VNVNQKPGGKCGRVANSPVIRTAPAPAPRIPKMPPTLVGRTQQTHSQHKSLNSAVFHSQLARG